MLPIMLDISKGPVVLYGRGPAADRRRQLLVEAGATDIRLFVDHGGPDHGGPDHGGPDQADLEGAVAVFAVGLDDQDNERVVALARRLGVLVNVEDRTALCDFYTPSVVRRGDLTIAISTAGKSPGLARRLRETMADQFGPEWGARLDELAERRAEWRSSGADMATVTARTNEYIDKAGWL